MGGMGVALDAVGALARRESLFRSKDVEALGVSHGWMPLATLLGVVQCVAPGIYGRAGRTYPDAAIAAVWVPRGIACLTTALELHGWRDVPKAPVWWALARTLRKPVRPPVPMRFVRIGPAAFAHDVERTTLEGVSVRVYSVERTVSDCVRWRASLAPDPSSTWWRRVEDEAQRLGIRRSASRWRLPRPASRRAADV